jgi:glycosyltransferase involved in cell wall biosynthesis
MGTRVKIGIISPYWLPRHGGAEQHADRISVALRARGFDLVVFSATVEDPAKDNGLFPADRLVRWSPDGSNLHCDFWANVYDVDAPGSFHFSRIAPTYAFMNAAVAWAEQQALDLAIVNSPMTRVTHFHTRELFLQLKARGIKVGLFHHDLGYFLRQDLVAAYEGLGDWEAAAQRVECDLRQFAERSALEAYYAADSPLFFEPDFVVANSHWSARFLDPLATTPTTVVHPLVDDAYWNSAPDQEEGLATTDVLMVNPLHHKGSAHMANLLRHARADWTYRILQGGYGESFRTFRPGVADLPAVRDGRVQYLEYVPDMREAYRRARLVFFPSLYEGYGMVAVEPLSCGTPVVGSSYPAILEAIGNAAPTVCPYLGGVEDWVQAVEQVLSERETWVAAAEKRVRELTARQEQELEILSAFLRAVR